MHVFTYIHILLYYFSVSAQNDHLYAKPYIYSRLIYHPCQPSNQDESKDILFIGNDTFLIPF